MYGKGKGKKAVPTEVAWAFNVIASAPAAMLSLQVTKAPDTTVPSSLEAGDLLERNTCLTQRRYLDPRGE